MRFLMPILLILFLVILSQSANVLAQSEGLDVPRDGRDYHDRGCAFYDRRNFAEALADFRKSCELGSEVQDYSYFRIWLIRARSGEEKAATQELAAYLKNRQARDWWPLQVGHFLTGEITETDLLKAAVCIVPQTDSQQHCEAYFYAGSKRLIENDRAGAADLFRKCLGTGETTFEEYHSAAAELGPLTSLSVAGNLDSYRNSALEMVVREANQVANELHLPEPLPITVSNLERFFIPPRDIGQRIGAIGTVTTGNYTYSVSVGDKFSYLESMHQDADRLRWFYEYSWPISRLDTNAAYQLATQWLNAVSMDVNGLNHDCELHVEPTGVRAGTNLIGSLYLPNEVDPSALRAAGTNASFLPVYWVYWTKGGEGHGSVASVELFAPTKTLMQLRVEDSEYILRKPLEVTNFDSAP